MAPDLRRIDERLERLEQECTALLRAAALSFDEWTRDEDLEAATERRLQVAVQAAIDIAAHLVTARGWTTPDGYGELFAELALRGVLDSALGARLRLAAGLRNLLVHDYMGLDRRRLHSELAADVDDLRAFASAVLRYLRNP